MRRLMYFAIGFAAACGVCAYGGDSRWKYPAAAGILLILCLIGERRGLGRKLLLAFFGCAMGFCWFAGFRQVYLSPVLPMDEQTVLLCIRASDYGEAEDGYTWVTGELTREEKTYRVSARLKGKVTVEPGMAFTGKFFVRVVPGGTGFLYAYQKEEVLISGTPERLLDGIADLRRDIKEILQETFPEDAFPFAKALLLGDTSDLSYKMDTDLKLSGVRHVVAVSGLHISILFGLLSMVAFRKRLLMALIGYPLLFFFAALTGFTPSVMRSCLMWGLVLLARLADEEYDGPTSLGFAVTVMLVLNPYVITSVGFQLSVASVAGIFLFREPVYLWLSAFYGGRRDRSVRIRLLEICSNSVAITVGAGILTTPLCAYYFGTVSLVGVVTNLLTLWLVSGIFYGILAVCLLYGAFPAAAAMLGQVLAWPVRYVLRVASVMADLPLAAVYVSGPYILAWLVFVYVLLAVFLILENRRPWIFGCCAALGLCLALLGDWTESLGDDVRFTVLDVGQGQCLVLQSEGRTFVVDCGGDSDSEAADQAAEYLLRQGIQTLDGLILTHLDDDHAGGAAGLLSRVDTELLILPETHSRLPECTDARLVCASEELEISWGSSSIKIYPATFPGNSNEKSLCILFETEKCDILITGDRDGFGERSLLRQTQLPDVDILVAGHHGAAASTCEELLTAVRPEIVCISVGRYNYYGHPNGELLQRLEAFGCRIYRTDIQGTITIRR